MKDAQKPDHISLNNMITRLRGRSVRNPRLSARFRVGAVGYQRTHALDILRLLYRQPVATRGP